MAGNVKFFGTNFVDDDCTYTLTSADSTLSSYLFDRDRNTSLTSIGSSDAANEDFVIEFAASKTFNRILIDNHNIKSGSLQYWNGSAYVDFSSAISWSANATTTHYYEFNSVSTTKIRLRMSTTITANDQKRVGSLYVMLELGDVSANPTRVPIKYAAAQNKQIAADNGTILVRFGKKFQAELFFSDATDADVTLFETLWDSGQSFHVYMCGGTGQTQRGYRLQDIYLVNFVNDFEPNLKGDLFGIGTTIKLELDEC